LKERVKFKKKLNTKRLRRSKRTSRKFNQTLY